MLRPKLLKPCWFLLYIIPGIASSVMSSLSLGSQGKLIDLQGEALLAKDETKEICDTVQKDRGLPLTPPTRNRQMIVAECGGDTGRLKDSRYILRLPWKGL